MTLNLRSYQLECIQAIKDKHAQGINRSLVHAATGAGKTVIFANLIQQMNCRTIVIAHTLELIQQSKDKILMISPNLDVGIVNADCKEFSKQIVVSTIQSARHPENLEKLVSQNFQLCIYDEAHHCSSDSARHVLDTLGFGKGSKKLLVGFTATPSRNDGRGIGEDFDEIVYSKDTRWMIENEYLCPPRGIKVATDLDLSTVKIDDSDFSQNALSKVMDTQPINDLVVRTYKEKALDRKTICFSVSVQHAHNLKECFRKEGITSEAISGSTPKLERERILGDFKNGKISVLTNCAVLTEGVDIPDTDCIIVAKPTLSSSLYCQMVGRDLRKFPNKTDCLILDFNDKNHSLCTVALLNGDTEAIAVQRHENNQMVSLANTLPSGINPKLRSVILEFDLLGDSFFWEKDGPNYFLRAGGKRKLRIVRIEEDRYDVIFINGNESQYVCQSLSFEYAFACAEQFAKENRSRFIVSDLEATWRNDSISDRQKEIFRSNGFRSGIDQLTKGQASTIIASGVLKRRARRI